jgi:hypothetical protein
VKAKIANLELEITVRSPLNHLKQPAPGKDVPDVTDVVLLGENYNMAPALVRVSVLNSSDVRVSKVTVYGGTELHLPQRPSKWTALQGAKNHVPIGECVSVGYGDASVLGGVAVYDSTDSHVGDANVNCDVKVVAGPRPAQVAPPIP